MKDQHHEIFGRFIFIKYLMKLATEYPNILNESWIVDIGAAKLADTPENFRCHCDAKPLRRHSFRRRSPNQQAPVGLAGSANIGDHGAMFEAIHGSAPRRAGQNLANPSGLILAAVQMLVYIDQPEIAEKIQNAWMYTLEQGIHTYDIL